MSLSGSDSYIESRNRFVGAAQRGGARLQRLPIAATGPDGESLSIDIAWLGATEPRQALLHVSGVHGVEAFTGSAIQVALLESGLKPAADRAIILIHALNPWGMAWWRRVNENNVDLNRNFLPEDSDYSGADTAYSALNALLNPPTPPALDAFLPRLLAALLRHGVGHCRNAILGGQYTFPNGLFYGGAAAEQSHELYRDWLRQQLRGVDYLLSIDVHTGLGRYGAETLLFEREGNSSTASELAVALRRPVQSVPAKRGLAYRTQGGHGGLAARLLAATRTDFLTQEFGTYSMLRLLTLLRAENRAFQHAPENSLAWRQKLLRALFPDDPGWRRRVVQQGRQTALSALTWINA